MTKNLFFWNERGDKEKGGGEEERERDKAAAHDHFKLFLCFYNWDLLMPAGGCDLMNNESWG